MAAMISDMHHKNGTNYTTGILEVRKYTAEFQNYSMRNFQFIHQNFMYSRFYVKLMDVKSSKNKMNKHNNNNNNNNNKSGEGNIYAVVQ
jgi:hypothetical protein